MIPPVAPGRGEVWLINFDPTVGREIQKTRPCVVVTPPEINDHLPVILVAPLTGGSRPAPFRVATAFAGTSGLMLVDQVRAGDRGRLVGRVGRIDGPTLSAALAVLRSLFAE